MSSIVRELQKDALDKNVPSPDLLRKSLVVARKLKIKEFEIWITNELNGYADNIDIPSYRTIRGELKALNSAQGRYIPVAFRTSDDEDMFSTRQTGQSVAELENLCKESEGQLRMPLPPEVQQVLNELGGGYRFPASLFIPKSRMLGVIDTVRTIVLNWTLKLEEDGILGEDFSFSTDELRKASRISHNVTNYYGPITNSQIQHNSNDSVQIMKTHKFDYRKLQGVLEQIEESLDKLQLLTDSKNELKSDLRSVKEQLKSPKPKDTIIQYGLSSILRILEAAGGVLAAEWIKRITGGM